MSFKQPVIWILFMGLLGALIMFLSTLFATNRIGLDVGMWSVILLTLNGFYELRKANKTNIGFEQDIHDMFVELGIPNGQTQYKIGLCTFAVGAAISWIGFYAESA